MSIEILVLLERSKRGILCYITFTAVPNLCFDVLYLVMLSKIHVVDLKNLILIWVDDAITSCDDDGDIKCNDVDGIMLFPILKCCY